MSVAKKLSQLLSATYLGSLLTLVEDANGDFKHIPLSDIVGATRVSKRLAIEITQSDDVAPEVLTTYCNTLGDITYSFQRADVGLYSLIFSENLSAEANNVYVHSKAVQVISTLGVVVGSMTIEVTTNALNLTTYNTASEKADGILAEGVHLDVQVFE
jgi:hypothetical protein